MPNPILQALNGNRPNLQMIKAMVSGKDPQAMFNEMMQSNPQFRDFINQNAGKTPQEIAARYGIDIGQIMK